MRTWAAAHKPRVLALCTGSCPGAASPSAFSFRSGLCFGSKSPPRSHSHSHCTRVQVTEQSVGVQAGLPSAERGEEEPQQHIPWVAGAKGRAVPRARVSPEWNRWNTYDVDARLSALFQPSECSCRATLLVNIHIPMVKEAGIQPLPGDNSQNISAISSGLQLKTLSQTSEMIHCTWLYIIMALVIIYYPFSFFLSFFF